MMHDVFDSTFCNDFTQLFTHVTRRLFCTCFCVETAIQRLVKQHQQLIKYEIFITILLLS
jgi:hypothetical protein